MNPWVALLFHKKETVLIKRLSSVNNANLWDLIAATGFVVSNEIQIDFSARVTLKFNRWPQETIGNLFHAPKCYVCHFMAIRGFKLELSSGNWLLKSKPNHRFLGPCGLENWQMTLKNNRAPFLYHFLHHFVTIHRFKLEIQSGNTQFGSKSSIFRPCDLKSWWMT